MEWFTCEKCNERLDKPLLFYHFLICPNRNKRCQIKCNKSAGALPREKTEPKYFPKVQITAVPKLEVSQPDIDGHIGLSDQPPREKTEPKYVPKVQKTEVPKLEISQPDIDGHSQPDIDERIGLSDQPPWHCSVCNINVNRLEILLMHGCGTKHKKKVRSLSTRLQSSKETLLQIAETVASGDNVGSSSRPPWFCSVCNISANGPEHLRVHCLGKKHKKKIREGLTIEQQLSKEALPKSNTEDGAKTVAAGDNVGLSSMPPLFCSENVRFHTANQQPSVEAVPETCDSAEDDAKTKTPDDESVADKENIPSNEALGEGNCLAKSRNISVLKKRKLDDKDDGSTDKFVNGLGNGIVTQANDQDMPKVKKAKLEPMVKAAESEKIHHEAEKEVERDEADARKESGKEQVKWKKLIVSLLTEAPDGALKYKKLQKLVSERLGKSGITVDDTDLSTILEHKVNSSMKFSVDGKYVRLAA